MKSYNAKVKIYRRVPSATADKLTEVREHWAPVGSAFELPSGQINLIIDLLPVREATWDGCIALFPREGT
jgi:hypothetical protein